MKRSGFKRKSTWKKLKPVSIHRVKDLKIYSGLRLQYLSNHPICEVCSKRNAVHLHHRRGRGIFLNEPKYFLSVCSFCHRDIHIHVEWAKARGYLIDRIGIVNE